VIFSNEKKFNLDGPDGVQYYWEDLSNNEHQEYSEQRNGGGGFMVWGCFSSKGKSELAILEGKINSQKYVYALSEYMLPFAHVNYGTDFLFQQDNAPIHVSKEANEIFMGEEIKLIKWSAKSPDLNPIENLWGYMVNKMYENGKQFQTKKELKDSLLETWDRILDDLLVTLLASMPNCCLELHASRGRKIDY